MPPTRWLRYLAPNLVTSMGIVFGLMSMVASFEHRFVDAGWLIIWAVLIDRLDGAVARLCRATSPFGVQMDSFADAINFGVAPSVLMFTTLTSVPELGLHEGQGRVLLTIACGVWTLANVFRLAKFNVISEDPKDAPPMFYGIATTLAAGTMIIWYLALMTYTPLAAKLGVADQLHGPRLLGDAPLLPLSVWGYMPAVMLVGAFLMASNLPTPKLGKLPSKPLTIIVLVNVLAGMVCGFARILPEYMVVPPTTWLIGSIIWGQLSPVARTSPPPQFLPREDEPTELPPVAHDEQLPSQP